jgi:organic radical activating enzyme
MKIPKIIFKSKNILKNKNKKQKTKTIKKILFIDKKQKIYGFWHVAIIKNWKMIFEDQFKTLVDSGLLEKTEKVFVVILYDEDKLEEIPSEILNNPKFEIILKQNLQLYEYATLEELWKKSQNEDFAAWYIHLKGATSCKKYGDDNWYWRKYMEYYIFGKWEECYKSLEKYDMIGVEWKNEPYRHFSGSFFWTKSNYVKKQISIKEYKSKILNLNYGGKSIKRKEYCFGEFYIANVFSQIGTYKSLANNKKSFINEKRFEDSGQLYFSGIHSLELDITYACSFSCINCDRICNLIKDPDIVTIDQIIKLLYESEINNYKWEKLRIVGGEPTLHPNFEDIVKVLYDYKTKNEKSQQLKIKQALYGDLPNGKFIDVTNKISSMIEHKIFSIKATNKNFTDPAYKIMKKLQIDYIVDDKIQSKTVYENEILQIANIIQLEILSNGFSDITKIKLKWLSEKYPEIKIINTNKINNNPSYHWMMTNTPIEINPEFYKYHNYKRCNLIQQCGIGFNFAGFYCCPMAGAIDRIFGLDLGIKSVKDISIESLQKTYNQLCSKCGLYSCRIHEKVQTISPTWKKALDEFNGTKLTRY